MRTFFYFSVFILLTFSCKYNHNISPNWNTNILGPLVKTDITLQNFSGIENIHAKKVVSLSEVSGMPTVSGIVPPVGPVDLPPYTLDLSTAFSQATFDKGSLYFVIKNYFPVNVKKGTQIIFTENNSVLSTNILPSNLNPGGSYTLSPGIDLTNKILYPQLGLQIKSFSSDGSQGKFVTVNSNDSLVIDIYVKDVLINSITVNTGNSFTIDDTTNFQVSGDVIKAKSISGNFNNYFDNGLPLSFDMQAYFLDENYAEIDSLFSGNTTIAPANIANCKSQSQHETMETIPYTSQKFNTLNNARFARLYFTIKSLGPCSSLTISKNDTLSVQIVGDLKLNVSNK